MYLYPAWIRLWHFISAMLILILIISGLYMQYAGGNDTLLLSGGFAKAVRWHNAAAIILILSYICFVVGNIISGNGRNYTISKNDLYPGLGRQLKYFIYEMFRKRKQPFPVTLQNKFNPLQKVTYLLIMYFALPLLIISGSVLMIPDLTLIRILGPDMYIITDILHLVLGLLISLFLLIHIYCCTLGPKPGSLFRGIITGYYGGD